MVTHIVLIKLRDDVEEKEAQKVASMIDSLSLKVPSIVSMETGINFADEERAMDIVLTAKFEDREGLQEYAVHPEHLKVIEYIKSVALYSKVVDYEKI
jgi:hypothetical protein